MKKKNVIAVAGLCALTMSHLGCTYALPGVVRSSTRKVKVTSSYLPSAYDIHADFQEPSEYQTDSEGKVDITIPAHRPPCSVYLFNIIKVGGGDQQKNWRVKIISQGKTLRQISIRDIDRLPVDSEGYHVLRIK